MKIGSERDAIEVEQFEDSVKFYALLGFKLLSKDGENVVLVRSASDRVHLRRVNKLQCARLILVDLPEQELLAIKAQLQQQKVEFTLFGNGKILVQDPSRNSVLLQQTEVHSTQTDQQTSPLHQSLNGYNAIKHEVKRRIAVLTSGGDSPGMNAAVRSIVRTAISSGCEAYAVLEGYTGLVEGGEKIVKYQWSDVQSTLSVGGTKIGTSRCAEFRERDGRKRSAYNMVTRGIDALIVVGGDGSLTGADLLRREWTGLLAELRDKDKSISDEQCTKYSHLNIVGLVGSIDNDMAMTDLTIGAVSSVHRICEAVDNISSTAMSHQRAFVVEVMGRNCGWLALMSAIACGADWFLIPEQPPKEYWEQEMCRVIQQGRNNGQRRSIIIVSEGAIDRNSQPIKSEYVKDYIANNLGINARVTTLGHIQRGGSPAVIDRYIGTVQGVKAVHAVLQMDEKSDPPVVTFSNNDLELKPLMKAVEATGAVASCIKSKDFDAAFKLRDPEFHACHRAYSEIRVKSPEALKKAPTPLRVAIIHCGAPAGGMNAASMAAVRCCINHGHEPYLISNGFSGLMAGEIKPAKWQDVEGWVVYGGSIHGTNRSQPDEDLGLVAYQLQKHGIQALLIIGGFEGMTSLLTMAKNRQIYPSLCIPMVLVPATVSNNVPGTELSLGADTALNVIVEACDNLRLSAHSSRKRVFVVEVQGGKCGYLATLAGLTCGATCSYIPEEGLHLKDIAQDSANLIEKYTSEGDIQGRVIVRNETASSTYTTQMVSAIFNDEGKGVFDAKSCILGHIQQGGSPSPLDRVRGTRFAVNAISYIEQCVAEHQSAPQQQLSGLADQHSINGGVFCQSKQSAVVIGMHKGTNTRCTPVEDLVATTDFKSRRSTLPEWWLPLNQLTRSLARLYTPQQQQEQ